MRRKKENALEERRAEGAWISNKKVTETRHTREADDGKRGGVVKRGQALLRVPEREYWRKDGRAQLPREEGDGARGSV